MVGEKVVVTTIRPERLTEKGLPISITLDLNVDPTTWEATRKVTGPVHIGYVYRDSVNEWFSTAIGRPVLLLHKARAQSKLMNRKEQIHANTADRSRPFTPAGVSLINDDSIKDIEI